MLQGQIQLAGRKRLRLRVFHRYDAHVPMLVRLDIAKRVQVEGET